MTEKQDFNQIATVLLRAIGGKSNITDVYHCANRLRIAVIDPWTVDKQAR